MICTCASQAYIPRSYW